MKAADASTTLSIVIAIRNAADMLRATLASIPATSSFSYEILIQDAVSTDDPAAVLQEFSYLPILFDSTPDDGIYDAWNKALAHRHGQWVIFVGAGDLFCWDNLENCIKHILVLPEAIEFYATPVKLITEAGYTLTTLRPSHSPARNLPQGMPFPHPGVFHRSSVFDMRSFDKRYTIAGDYDFFCRTLKINNVAIGDTVFISMLIGGISGCLDSMHRSERELLQIAKAYFPHSLPWKPHLRLLRSKLYRIAKSTAGAPVANFMADIPRMLQGKSRLWSSMPTRALRPLPPLSPTPGISLLVATLGRQKELDNLLTSLEKQTYKNFHVVIADQNPKGFLDEILARHATVPITHLLLPAKGVSLARNALFAHANGNIIAFPDDDCWYAADTLESVVAVFRDAPQCGALLGIWTASPNAPLPQLPEGTVKRRGLFQLAGTCVQFYRREAVANLRFDPQLGPGTALPYGSGEDTDFLLCAYQQAEVRRSSRIRVFHPSPKEAIPAPQKVASYAAGRMYLLQKHKFPLWFVLANILFPLGVLPLDAVRYGKPWVRYRWTMFRERLRNWRPKG